VMKNDGGHHGPASVDRAYGAVKESAILPVMLFACTVDTFENPANNAEYKEFYEIN